MEYEEFKKLLDENSLTVVGFSKLSSTKYRTCINWSLKGRSVPSWVKPFINLYAKNIECMKYKDSLEVVLKGLSK